MTASVSGANCDWIITLQNSKNYWTQFSVNTVGSAVITPVGGDLNLYAKFKVLPPSSFFPLPSGKSVSFNVHVSRPGDAIRVFADPTVESGYAAAQLNGLQALLNVLPFGGTPLLVVDDYQKVAEAFQRMPHLQNTVLDLLQVSVLPGFYVDAAKQFYVFLGSDGEVAAFAELSFELGFNITLEVIKAEFKKVGIVWRVINALAAEFGNFRTAFFQYPAGSLFIVAQ
jgi:hypothetical protein